MKGPGFKTGNCLMVETLNKPEVEYVGPLLVERLKRLERETHIFRKDCQIESVVDARNEIKTLKKILAKMDYPFKDAA